MKLPPPNTHMPKDSISKFGTQNTQISGLLSELKASWPSLNEDDLVILGLRSLETLCHTTLDHARPPEFTPDELANEIWRPLPRFPGCAVSNLGRVRGGVRNAMNLRKVSRQRNPQHSTPNSVPLLRARSRLPRKLSSAWRRGRTCFRDHVEKTSHVVSYNGLRRILPVTSRPLSRLFRNRFRRSASRGRVCLPWLFRPARCRGPVWLGLSRNHSPP